MLTPQQAWVGVFIGLVCIGISFYMLSLEENQIDAFPTRRLPRDKSMEALRRKLPPSEVGTHTLPNTLTHSSSHTRKYLDIIHTLKHTETHSNSLTLSSVD